MTERVVMPSRSAIWLPSRLSSSNRVAVVTRRCCCPVAFIAASQNYSYQEPRSP
ncbi:hypothetical protein ACFW53_00885 [Nocardiopsis dassonvillei]|uniref:hypothetical protein n=1 Tax=Nocardiopsis dassonvillei TaxID=2014 RepID=UPI00366C332D